MRRVVFIGVALLIGAALVTYFFFPQLLLALAQRMELRAARLQQRSVDVGDQHIEYLVGGTGEPLVLLHGFGGDKSVWVRVAKHLTPHFRVVALDLPGFGDSTRDPRAHYGIAE